MNSRPLVSIITPSYNQAEYLEETIASVLGQSYPNLEYIVVDGGSTDGSPEIIARYTSRLAWWVSEPDLGQTDAINKGFAGARGEILAWLNSDDLYLPGAVSEAVEFLQANPQVGLVYGDADYINKDGEIIGRFPARQASLSRLQRGAVHIPQQASFFRADLWRRVGPLDPSFYFAMDYDLWVRLAALAPFYYVPRLWAQFRLHSSGKSIAEDALCWPEMMRVHWREGGGWAAPIVARYLARRLLAPVVRRRRSNLAN
ncbi:MAG: glycosyltransferase family 2 protein [Anaerolineales bacterium]|nr:glycosyltransferase family 2 protein [Anaerolineales bacterium]